MRWTLALLFLLLGTLSGAGEARAQDNPWQMHSTEYSRVSFSGNTSSAVDNASIPPGTWEVAWNYHFDPSSNLYESPDWAGVRMYVVSSFYPTPSITPTYLAPRAQVWEDVFQGPAIVTGPGRVYFQQGYTQYKEGPLNPHTFTAFLHVQWRQPTGVKPTPQHMRYRGTGVPSVLLPGGSTRQISLPTPPEGAQVSFRKVIGLFNWPTAAGPGAAVSLVLGSANVDSSYSPYYSEPGSQLYRWIKGTPVTSFEFPTGAFRSSRFALVNNDSNAIDSYELVFTE